MATSDHKRTAATGQEANEGDEPHAKVSRRSSGDLAANKESAVEDIRAAEDETGSTGLYDPGKQD